MIDAQRKKTGLRRRGQGGRRRGGIFRTYSLELSSAQALPFLEQAVLLGGNKSGRKAERAHCRLAQRPQRGRQRFAGTGGM